MATQFKQKVIKGYIVSAPQRSTKSDHKTASLKITIVVAQSERVLNCPFNTRQNHFEDIRISQFLTARHLI